jgi:hypothetical protein
MHEDGQFARQGDLARFMPWRLATAIAQRLRAEKRSARVSMMCAAS